MRFSSPEYAASARQLLPGCSQNHSTALRGQRQSPAESVLLAVAEHYGIESEWIPKIATSIGAGFALNGLTCGSISGTAMAIGLKHGRTGNEEEPQITWHRIDAFIDAFK